MIVRTSQQQTSADCCACDTVTSCANPRIETRPPCGYTLGDNAEAFSFYYKTLSTTGTPDADFVGVYKKVTLVQSIAYDVENTGYGYTYTESFTGTFTQVYTISTEEDGDCVTNAKTGSATWSSSYSPAYEDTPTGDYLVSYSQAGSCGATTGSCGGTETPVYAESGADPNSTGGIDFVFDTATSQAWADNVWTSTHPEGTYIATFEERTQGSYRFGVPADYSTGPDPRSTWEMQWDEVFASAGWWAWFDAGMIGTEPTPVATLHASQSWTWGGSMAAPWSSWFEPIIEAPGEIRPVNVMIRCYNSTRIGTKPTAYGDQVAL